MIWLVFTLIGTFAGAFGSLLGLGGGIILVPALLYFGSTMSGVPAITPQLAIGTSLMLIIVTAFSSTISYAQKKLVDFRSAFLFFYRKRAGGGHWCLAFRFF